MMDNYVSFCIGVRGFAYGHRTQIHYQMLSTLLWGAHWLWEFAPEGFLYPKEIIENPTIL